jgi:carboxypeptidase Q
MTASLPRGGRGGLGTAGAFLAACCIANAACRNAQTRPARPSPAARLAQRALGETPLALDTRELCSPGGRLTGSTACARAEEWAAARFEAAGVPAALETYTMPSVWRPGASEGRCLVPEEFALRLAAAPGSPPTPGRVFAGPLVNAGKGTPAEFARLGPLATDAIALVEDDAPSQPGPAPWLAPASRLNVGAVLLRSSNPEGVLERRVLTPEGGVLPFPVAILAGATFARLSGLLERGEVRVEISLSCETAGPVAARNVVAEIRGREREAEVVLLGAHLDSWDLGEGANDDAVNAALVIDVARGFRELGLVPRRSVRFVLFTGEEQGLRGSHAYVAAHEAELARNILAVVFDLGSGPARGFYLNGRKDLRPSLDRALAGQERFRALFHLNALYSGTDSFAFVEAGVPAVAARQDLESLKAVYHAETDTIDRVDFTAARANAALAATLVWETAEEAGPSLRRLSAGEVRELLARQGMAPSPPAR